MLRLTSLALTLLALAPQHARAQEALELELEPPASLRVGDRAEVIVRVRGAGAHPILITPRSEGIAVEVVRGRLMRSDAADPSAEVLELRLPVVARVAGAAVLRVSAQGYRCEARCRSIRGDARTVLHVASGAAKKQSAPETPTTRTSSLSWVRLPGAEDCLTSTSLARAVEERLDRRVFVSAAEGSLAVEGRAERVDTGFRAVLSVTDAGGASLGERTLESASESCDELGEMVAVAVALMIDPLTAPDPAPAPTPDPPPAPEPVVIVRTERVEVPVPAVPAEPAERWRVEIDASLVGAVGLLPTLALGGLSAVILDPPDFVPVMIEGALIPWSRAEGAGGHVDFLHVHAGVQICPLDLREGGLALYGCLGADAGAVIVIGGDLEVQEGERVIGQAHAALRGHWDVIGPLTLRAGLHLLVPFRHDPFVIAGTGATLYAPEPVAGMLDIGAAVHFP